MNNPDLEKFIDESLRPLEQSVSPIITGERTMEDFKFCKHNINTAHQSCMQCISGFERDIITEEKPIQNQLSLVPTTDEVEEPKEIVNSAPIIKKSTLTEEQKVAIIRQAVEHIAGFNGDIWTVENLKPKTYYLQGNGLWVVVDKSFARLCNKINEQKYLGEYSVLERAFNLKIPKMPGSILSQILAFFRHYVIDEGITSVTEAMTQVYFDPIDQEYFVNIPRQEVNGAHVTYMFDQQDPRIKLHNCAKVWDIHSHNTMSSFFSATDDGDEQGQQFYGVMGNITKDTHTWAFRMGIDGNFASISNGKDGAINALVDMSSFTEQGTYPKEWESKVSLEDWKSKQTTIVPITSAYDHSSYGKDWGKDWGHEYHNGSFHGYGGSEFAGGSTDWTKWNREGQKILVRKTIDDLFLDLKDPSDIRYFARELANSFHCREIIDHYNLQIKITEHRRTKKKGK